MKKLVIAIAVLFAASSLGYAQQDQPIQLKVGDVAPDFTLTDTAGTKAKLSDLRGKSNVVLAFYIFAFTGG